MDRNLSDPNRGGSTDPITSRGVTALALPSDFDLKERVRSAVELVDVVGGTLELRPQGRGYVARCPWHNDRKPSLTVNTERQTWKCWVCDIGGDIFSFVMQRDGCDFPTAVGTLAEVAGIPVEEYRRGPKTQYGQPNDRQTLLDAIELVTTRHQRQLDTPESDDARAAADYLASRGIGGEFRRRFRIGFAPDRWDDAVTALAAKGFDGAVAAAAGLASPRRSGDGHVDMFRGRLMFPIIDLQNRPIALGGRVIPSIAERHGDHAGGKYINGRETLLFKKSTQLYGLNLARDPIRKTGTALVMEGYTDVIAAHIAGIENAVAVLGTALTESHVKVLRRFAKRVVLVLDGDEAGRKRADEVLEVFVKADVDLRVMTLPDGMDPADFISRSGRGAFEQLATAAPDALDHRLARLTDGVDVANDTHAVTAAVDSMLRILATAADGIKTDQMLGRLARTFGLRPERLEQRLAQFRKSRPRPRSTNPPPTRPRRPSATIDPDEALAMGIDVDSRWQSAAPVDSVATDRHVTTPPLTGIDRELFEALIEQPDLAGIAVEAIDPNWLHSITGKMLLSAYQDLDLAGRPLDFDSLMLVIENESLKNHMVSLQSRIESRPADANFQSPADRYAAIVTRYRERGFAAEKHQQIERLATAMLDEEDELKLLQSMFDQERLRHLKSD